jgi:hypothetical protein
MSVPIESLDAGDVLTKNAGRVAFHSIGEGEIICGNLENFFCGAIGILEP